VCLGFSALVFVWLEAEKLYLRTVHQRHAKEDIV
jgi:hypothetical protein